MVVLIQKKNIFGFPFSNSILDVAQYFFLHVGVVLLLLSSIPPQYKAQ